MSPHARVSLVLLCIAPLVLSACDMPRDPEDTLERVRGGELRVGVVAQPPLTDQTTGEPTGPEADLARDLADRLDARIRWTPGGETDLFARLERFELDLVIGGLTTKTPGAKRIALTAPYAVDRVDGRTHRRVFAAPPGENAWVLFVDRFIHERRRERTPRAPEADP